MADIYDQPPFVDKRVRYFDGQFLKDQDFIDEQKYHVDRQRRLSQSLQVAGICQGLTVEPAAGQITITPGTALDRLGRQIVLGQAQLINLASYSGNQVDLYIAYQVLPSDPSKAGEGTEGNSRWHEAPKLAAVLTEEPSENDGEFTFKGRDSSGSEISVTLSYPVQLGRLAVDAEGKVTVQTDALYRGYSGVRLPAANHAGPVLRSGGDKASHLAVLQGDFRVNGNLSLTGNVSGALKIEASPEPSIPAPEPPLTVKAANKNTPLNGWYEAIRLSQTEHSAITHPGGGLLFGLHSDRNFYFADIDQGKFQKYVLTISAASGNVTINQGNLTVAGSISGSIHASQINGGELAVARIPALDTGKITTGTFNTDRIPPLDASKTTTGTFNTDRIPPLDTGKITTGTFNTDRIPALDASKIASGTLDPARIPTLGADKITTGKITGNIEVAGSLTIRGNIEVIGNCMIVGKTPTPSASADDHQLWLRGKRITTLDNFAVGWASPTPSDIRLKENIHPIATALNKVTQLQGVTYRWNAAGLDYFTQDIEANFSAGSQATAEEHQTLWDAERAKHCAALAGSYLGLIAQDVEAVVPEVVRTDAAGYKGIDYAPLNALLVEAIKEQQQLLQQLLGRLEALERQQIIPSRR
jgi:hypothetical protein